MADYSLDEYISKRGIAAFNNKGFGNRLGLKKNAGIIGSKITVGGNGPKGNVGGPKFLSGSTSGPNANLQPASGGFDARAKITAKSQSTTSVPDARQKLNQKTAVPDARQTILQKKQMIQQMNQQQHVQGNMPLLQNPMFGHQNPLFGNVQQQQMNMLQQQPQIQQQPLMQPQRPFQMQPIVFGAQEQSKPNVNVQGSSKTRVLLTSGVRLNTEVKQNQPQMQRANQLQGQRAGISSRLQGRLGVIGQQKVNNEGSQVVGFKTPDISLQVQQFQNKVQQQRQPFMQQQQSGHSQQQFSQQPRQQSVKMQQPGVQQFSQQFGQNQRQHLPMQQQIQMQPMHMQQQMQQQPLHMQQPHMQQPHMQQHMQPSEVQKMYDVNYEQTDEDMYGYDAQEYSNDFNEGSGLVTFHGGSIQKVISGNNQEQQLQHLTNPSNNVISGRQTLKRKSYDLDQQQQQLHGETFSHPPGKVMRRDAVNVQQQQQRQQQLQQQRQQQLQQQQRQQQQHQQQQAKAAEFTSPLQGVRVTIGNLLPIVTLDDIVELFGAMGALKRARFVRAGLAEVVFVDEQAAIRAVKKYHQRELDGQPMQVMIQSRLSGQTAKKPLAGQTVRSASDTDSIELDADILHRALFKTSSATDAAHPTGPVNFTVHM